MIQPNPFYGAFFLAVGALLSAACYSPSKLTRHWAWEIYWVAQATFAWCILPLVGAWLTVPDYLGLLAACSPSVMLNSFLLGLLYGVGGFTFGLGVRYIGFSLNYSIAIGISALLGTLLPLVWTPTGGFVHRLGALFQTTPGWIVFVGLMAAVGGIALCGWAGALRERLAGGERFDFARGLPYAVAAGILGAVFNYALLAGKPLSAAAAAQVADGDIRQLLQNNAVYPFACGGAWVTNVVWGLYLGWRNMTWPQLYRLSDQHDARLRFYYLLAFLSGAMWYLQFFCYGIGETYMGERFGFTSWALLMAILILASNLLGTLFREWEGTSPRPRRMVHLGMAVIILATCLVTCGNYLGQNGPSPSGEGASVSTETPPGAD